MELNFDLNYSGFEDFLKLKNYPLPNTVHYLFRFPNGYGASVEKGPYTYGSIMDQWDVRIVVFPDDPDDVYWVDIPARTKGPLECDRYIYCDDERVREILQRIKDFVPELLTGEIIEKEPEDVPVCQDCIHYEACLAMDDNFNMCERNMAVDCMVRKSKKDYEIVQKKSQN